MNLDPLEAEVLGWLLDDVDTPKTPAGNVVREFGRSTTEDAVCAALARLVASGLAQAFEFDPRLQTYRPIAVVDRSGAAAAWFVATRAGRALLEPSP
ncbi:hypothetical protein SBBP1_1330007 [Burkholderiales bacterium]|nr:hypothetical protein SBBP1_1330007 [Burkholderiales bacterium]